ncbi:hypothetical protein [Deinococcus pimensis]|uniref:hypothetical protein n=1 Tax=Deinococcus pimensis TaxID=309888 RepID=UPI0004879752|nr:hypothetical protein [Deinococcus pimensis]
MLRRTEREGLTVITSDRPEHATRAVVEGPDGAFLVDTVEEPYTDNEGAVYDPEAFVSAVLDAFRAGRGQAVESAGEVFGE